MISKGLDTAEAVVGWIREVLPFLPGEEYKALEIELPDLVLLEAYISHLEAVAEAARELDPPPDDECRAYMVRADVMRRLRQALEALDQGGSQPPTPEPAEE